LGKENSRGSILGVRPGRQRIVLRSARRLAASVRQRRDEPPFYMVALIFVAAFGTLAISFWPYMIPFTITIADAAAPHSSLAFMFWGEGLFVFPLMLVYRAISYSVFRGKVRSASANY
jgi:cytochrome d ubiquinol oxidase subunit II